mmetsp:Transcript_66554/g.214488  ORF Transcript_66554/g.214488 Transcript_66554/m.214488 type:complete len:169 (+) Transcript_66554:805-1311(+)
MSQINLSPVVAAAGAPPLWLELRPRMAEECGTLAVLVSKAVVDTVPKECLETTRATDATGSLATPASDAGLTGLACKGPEGGATPIAICLVAAAAGAPAGELSSVGVSFDGPMGAWWDVACATALLDPEPCIMDAGLAVSAAAWGKEGSTARPPASGLKAVRFRTAWS